MKLSKWISCFVLALLMLQFVAQSNANASIIVDGVSQITPNQEFDVTLPYVVETSVVIDGTVNVGEYVASYEDPISGVIAYWEHNTTVINVALVSPSPDGTGWVALGIQSITDRPEMEDANIIIGGLDGTAYGSDTTGTAGAPILDVFDDLIQYGATETDGSTTFEFQFPLNSGDSADPEIVVGGLAYFFLGYSSSDSLAAAHELGSGHSGLIIVNVDDEPSNTPNFGSFDESIPLVETDNIILDGIVSVGEYPESYYDQSTGMTIYWRHNNIDITFALDAPGTGWVAIGFGITMLNSSMIIGGLDGSTPYCNDLNGLVDWEHADDTEQGGTDDIIGCGATETELGHTIFEFSIPMDSGDPLDPVFEESSVFPMFFGYHASSDDRTSVHTAHSWFIGVLIRPFTVSVISELIVTAPTEIQYNESFTIEIHLQDNNSNAYAGREVEFYIRTALGDLIFDSKITDINGDANASYRNEHMIYDHAFGARFKQVVEVPVNSTELTAFLGIDATQMITFIGSPEEEDPLFKQYSRGGLVLIFWITGIVIWLSFSLSIWGVIQIILDREKGDKNKGGVTK